MAWLALGAPATSAALELREQGPHVDLSGSLAAWNVFRLDPDTPSERPSSTLDLRFQADHARRLYFTLATRLGYDGKIGNPNRGNPILDLDDYHQDKDIFVGFDEAYVDVVFRHFELRLGKQKISWGRLDELQPTDNLNPEDLSEFFFRPELERKIGVPGARLTSYFGDWTAEVVWNPIYTAIRFPNREDRWFPPLLEVPDRVATTLGTLPVRTRYPDVDEPPHTLASSDAAFRIMRPFGSAELAASVFHGWDKTSTFGTRGTATLVPTGDASAPVATNVDLEIFPTIHRVTIVGWDLAVPVWVLALRAEAAWIHGRFFPVGIRDQLGSDPQLVATVNDAAGRVAASGQGETITLPVMPIELERDAVQYGIGFDYTMTEAVSRRLIGSELLARSFVLLQLIETVIPDHDGPFLHDQIEHLLGLTLRHTFRDDRLLAELKIAYNPNHGDYFLWPQLTYQVTPALHALFEARVIGGTATQEIGQYRDHDGIKIGLRRFF